MNLPLLSLPSGPASPHVHASKGPTRYCKFKSGANGKYLSALEPTLTATFEKGTVFQLDANDYLMQNGKYLTAKNSPDDQGLAFYTSLIRDVKWDGAHLVSNMYSMAIDIYDKSGNRAWLWNPNDHINQNWECIEIQERAPCIEDSEAECKNTLPHQFTLATYNCLYTEYTDNPDKLSGYELEMVTKTARHGTYQVKNSNLGWSVRLPRITKNLLEQGPPDVVLLQEATPEMCNDIVKATFPSYHSAQSAYGMGTKMDGYCHVLFDPLKFRMQQAKKHTQHAHQRFVGVLLLHLQSNKKVFVASTHLPADGSAPVAPIEGLIQEECREKWPVVIGGDFNVTHNPFSTLHNLSGEDITFYNDYAMKLDWVVGRHVNAVGVPRVNSVKKDQGRWPNEVEGSDHTAVFVRVAFK